MEEIMTRLEHRFEDALLAYLQAEGSEDEAEAYLRFLEAFEALKAFDSEVQAALLTA